MNKELNYKKVFDTLISELSNYITSNGIKAMILGISGGIDSTVVAAICYEVSIRTGIPLIGRSLPIKNKEDEFSVSKLVGEAFCTDFKIKNLQKSYQAALLDACLDEGEANEANSYFLDELEDMPSRTPIANGNLQARCRNHHLYDLAGRKRGMVMSTDNQSEYQLGFWTRHGDEGDYDPIMDLWKTEVYELARWLVTRYQNIAGFPNRECWENRAWKAIAESIKLTPTDGLGISNSDLDQIGAKSYSEVDDILSRYIPFEKYRKNHGEPLHPHDEMAESDCWSQLCARYSSDVVEKVWNRHIASEFKRKKSPIYIPREKYA